MKKFHFDKRYLIILGAALVLYIIGVTYQLATIEHRLGQIEHKLVCGNSH